jgi:hypothetical protein
LLDTKLKSDPERPGLSPATNSAKSLIVGEGALESWMIAVPDSGEFRSSAKEAG